MAKKSYHKSDDSKSTEEEGKSKKTSPKGQIATATVKNVMKKAVEELVAEACLHSSEGRIDESANSKLNSPSDQTNGAKKHTFSKKKLSDKTSSSGGSRKKAKPETKSLAQSD